MPATHTRPPGVDFVVLPRPAQQLTLRTDIAGFLGQTRRGPVLEAIRVGGWRHFQAVFGGVAVGKDAPLALRGYFENGGQVGYFIRTLGEPHSSAQGLWKVGDVDPVTDLWGPDSPSGGGFTHSEYQILASSPGIWANGTQVKLSYVLLGAEGRPQMDIEVHSPDEAVEYLPGLPPNDLETAVAERSNLIRIRGTLPAPAPVPGGGPLSLEWSPAVLEGAIEQVPNQTHYVTGSRILGAQPEVALLAIPDLYAMRGTEEQRDHVLAQLVAEAEQRHDRQVVTTTPPQMSGAEAVTRWLRERRQVLGENLARTLVVYHPWLDVLDPLGGIGTPLRRISPVGHVSGVISRLDRERGAHHTPANALLFDAVDVASAYELEAQGALTLGGVNLLRCQSGRGLQVWGGRTAADPRQHPEGLFLAHRRLIHRLVRAIRRITDPLVFDVNGPELCFKIVRGITSVLLQAFRAGALKGARPEEGFEVRCDESLNPPEEIELGRVLCEIRLAPAAPMEFITLRIAVSQEGRLEVIEP